MNSIKTIMLLSAGKLATIPGTSTAAGKEEAPKEKPPLSLHEMANPIDAIIPPMNHSDYEHKGTSLEQTAKDFQSTGIIFAGDKGELRLDFIVNHLFFPKDVKELDVFIAYSSSVGYFEDNENLPGLGGDYYDETDVRAGHIENKDQKPSKRPVHKPGKPLGDRVQPNKTAPKPPKVAAGQLCLDMSNVQILAGVRVHAPQQFLDAPTPLGKVLPNPNSVSVSVKLSDLHNFEGDQIFIQALAVPAGEELNFEKAQASECDRFMIIKPEANNPGSGSKADPFNGTTTDGQPTSNQSKIPE
jgi:hypothetical protein